MVELVTLVDSLEVNDQGVVSREFCFEDSTCLYVLGVLSEHVERFSEVHASGDADESQEVGLDFIIFEYQFACSETDDWIADEEPELSHFLHRIH